MSATASRRGPTPPSAIAERGPKGARLGDRLLAWLGVRLALWMVVVGALVPAAIEAPHRVTAHYDEHYFFAHDDAARVTMVDFHQLPAWNPYYCGGIPLAANPQDEALSPDAILRVAFGTALGRHLAIILFIVLGLEGTFRLARRHGASAIASAVAAVGFAASGRFYFMIEFGWINMFGFQLLPWVVLGFEEGAGRGAWRWRVLGGAFLAWMLLAAGTYTVPYTVLVLGALALWDTLEALLAKRTDPRAPASLLHPLLSFATVGVVAVVLSAAKLFPMLRVILEHPRLTASHEAFSLFQLLESILLTHTMKRPPIGGDAYIGGAFLVLAVLGCVLRDRAAARWLAMALAFLGLAFGDQGPRAAYTLLHKLPLYGQLRNPERFTLVVAFFLALGSASALTALEDAPITLIRAVRARWRSFRRRDPSAPLPLVAALLGGATGAALGAGVGLVVARSLVQENQVRGIFSADPPLAYATDFRQSRGNRWDAHVWARVGRGTLQCFEENRFPQSDRLRADLPAEEYPLDPSRARVERVSWSPNRIALHVVATDSTPVVVNQNFDRGWTADAGEVLSSGGLLAVVAPPGDRTIVLTYRDGWLTLGVAVSLLGAIACAVALARWLRARAYGARARWDDARRRG